MDIQFIANIQYKDRKRLNAPMCGEALEAFCKTFPRLATFDGSVLSFRQFPTYEQGQIKCHNGLMTVTKVTLNDVSAPCVAWATTAKTKGLAPR